MRTDLPAGMGDIWRSGDYIGAQRPFARVTLQHTQLEITNYEYTNQQAAVDSTLPGPHEPVGVPVPGMDTTSGVRTGSTVSQQYASVIFGSKELPKELPNVKSVQWSRALGQDFATATIVFYNTTPLPIGVTPTRDFDLPGYYTYNRGQTSFANRWGQTPNEWQNLLMPDNTLRTYEGYGFNSYVAPEKDEHLLQTGVWLIDKVEYTHTGLITCTCRDVGRILGDQIVFPPVIPKDFYPLSYGSSGLATGLIPPKTFTYSVDSGGKHDPNHPPPDGWAGPFDPPSNVHVVSVGDRTAIIHWNPPNHPESIGTDGNWVNGGPSNVAQVVADIDADNAALGPLLATLTAATAAQATAQAHYNTAVAVPRSHNLATEAAREAAIAVRLTQLKTAMKATGDAQAAVDAMQAKLAQDVVRLQEAHEGPFQVQANIQADHDNMDNAYQAYERARALPHSTPGETEVRNEALALAHAQNVAAQAKLAADQAELASLAAATDDPPTRGYLIAGYQLVLDGVRLPEIYEPNPGQIHPIGWTGYELQVPSAYLRNGVTYSVHMVAIWREDYSPQGELYFKTNVELEEVSDRSSEPIFIRPHLTGAPDVTPSIGIDNPTVSRGTWDAATAYAINDVVEWQGYYYLASMASTNKVPPDSQPVSGAWDSTHHYAAGDSVVFEVGSDLFTYYATGTPLFGVQPNLDAAWTRVGAWQQIGGIHLNVDAEANLYPGAISFTYDDKGKRATWKVIAYKEIDATGLPADRRVYSVATEPGGSALTIFTGTDLGDLTEWNYIAYGIEDGGTDTETFNYVWHPNTLPPVASGVTRMGSTWTGVYPPEPPDLDQAIGVGDIFFRTNGSAAEFFNRPIAGAAPHDPGPAPTMPTINTVTSSTTATTELSVNVPTSTPVHTTRPVAMSRTETPARLDDTSNTYYLGGKDKPYFGHTPDMAFDTSTSSYWLSIGNMRKDKGYSYEWIQATLDNITLDQVEFTTAGKNYDVYVSVFAHGAWRRLDSSHVIPYNPSLPESHNGGDIPFIKSYNCGDSEGPHTITFDDPIPGATKVRITLHNLQSFEAGPYEWHAGVRDIKAFVQTGGGTEDTTTQKPGHSKATADVTTTTTSVTTTVTPAPVVAGPPQDDDDPEIVRTYEITIPAHIQPGAGTMPGMYSDYTDIVKLFCAWGGFFWPEHATEMLSDGSEVQFDFGTGKYGLENVDPVLGAEGSGRVWGDFEQTGTSGPAPIPVSQWDKHSLMDGISFIRDIIGFIFYVDEQGGIVWRNPNVFAAGNWIGNYAQDAGRTTSMVNIDERQTLIGLTATLDGGNVRERVFVGNTDGKHGALAKGWNPNPTGMRRLAGWTDQHFMSNAECQLMADLVALRQLFTYRTDKIVIPAYPCIQVDDQVRIFEQVTGEGYVHYVKGISSSNDLEAGDWTYQLDTHWLGEDPTTLWVFQTEDLSEETKAFLKALSLPAGSAMDQGVI